MINIKRGLLVWVIVFSLTIGFLYLFGSNTLFRKIITPIYLFIHPGMTYVGFLRLKDWISNIAIGIAISFIMVAAVAALLMAFRFWNPEVGLYILAIITILGAIVQLFQLNRNKS